MWLFRSHSLFRCGYLLADPALDVVLHSHSLFRFGYLPAAPSLDVVISQLLPL